MQDFAVMAIAISLLALTGAILALFGRARGSILFNATYGAIVGVLLIPFNAGVFELTHLFGGGFVRIESFAGSLIAFVLLNDFLEYAIHFSQHKIPFLWRFHSLHHSDETVNPTTAFRLHWVDVATRMFVTTTAVAVILDINGSAIAAGRWFYTFFNMLAHLDWNLGWGRFWWLLNSPQYHRCHHGADRCYVDRNMADLFPFWDIVFGTAYRPRGEQPATGIMPRRQVSSPLAALFW